MLFQPPLPAKYNDLSTDQIFEQITKRKEELGSRLVILGHHYQQDDVIRFADYDGDSLKLAIVGAEQKEAEFIVFCGVHFMAESADILTSDDVKVILPDLSAGCSMADMADLEQVEDAWKYLVDSCGADIIPITYVNSTASIKAFCGSHGGACCTSSNAKSMLEWAFKQGERVMFLPDQHLGRNTAYAMNIPYESMVVYDPHQENGGLTPKQVLDAKVILWKGHCSVHEMFRPENCDEIRAKDPEIKIIVHPECEAEVVEKADLAGSTEFIINAVRSSDPGTKWAIGTEVNLVNRLASIHKDKHIQSLTSVQCLCTTMYRIDPSHLLWVLDELAEGRVTNQIRVDAETAKLAIVALERMLANVPSKPIAISG